MAINGNARELFLKVPCCFHPRCDAVGVTGDRWLTFRCGHWIHTDGRYVRWVFKHLPKEKEMTP